MSVLRAVFLSLDKSQHPQGVHCLRHKESPNGEKGFQVTGDTKEVHDAGSFGGTNLLDSQPSSLTCEGCMV